MKYTKHPSNLKFWQVALHVHCLDLLQQHPMLLFSTIWPTPPLPQFRTQKLRNTTYHSKPHCLMTSSRTIQMLLRQRGITLRPQRIQMLPLMWQFGYLQFQAHSLQPFISNQMQLGDTEKIWPRLPRIVLQFYMLNMQTHKLVQAKYVCDVDGKLVQRPRVHGEVFHP